MGIPSDDAGAADPRELPDPHHLPMLDGSARPHVAVVGAGIVGASCAWHLAERGARVTVFERAPAPAAGSTGRSAAGIRHQFSHPVNVRMSRYSAAAFDAFDSMVGASAGYRRVGYLFLIPADLDAAWREQHAMLAREGARAERLGPAELAARFPWIDPGGLVAASFGPDDGVLDPHAITLGYLAAARRRGATVLTGRAVVGATAAAGGWRLEVARGERAGDVESMAFDAVVNAAGPAAAEVAALAGVELPVTPLRRCVYVTAPLPEFGHHPTPLTVDLTTGVYLRSEGERILFGLSNPDEAPGRNLAVDWRWLQTTLERAVPRFPLLERAALDRRACWAGLYSVTPDHAPILGVPEDRGGWCNAAGFSGHGVQHAPATGRLVAEELLDGAATSFDLAPFRLERFAGSSARSGDRRAERNIV